GVSPVAGAVVGVLVAAAAIFLAGRDERLGTDTGVAVAVSALVGAGALLALTAGTPPRLRELLFGDLLGVTDADLAVAGGLAVLVLVALAAGGRALAAATFDPAAARSLGAPPGRWRAAVLVLL